MANQNTKATHCQRGHAFTPDNLRKRTDGARACLKCWQAWYKLERVRYRDDDAYRTLLQEQQRSRRRRTDGYLSWRTAKYRMTEEEYKQKFVAQAGLCAICRDRAIRDIDHDHKTGKARDLLCHRCNLIVGFFENMPSLMDTVVAYLRRWGV